MKKKVDIGKLDELCGRAKRVRDELKYILNYEQLQNRESMSKVFNEAHHVSLQIQNIFWVEEYAAKPKVYRPRIFFD